MKKPILLALPLLILMACTQEHPIDISEESVQQSVRSMPRKWGDETLGIDTAAFKAIAQKLVMSEMPLSVCEDVHHIIQNSMDAGVSEACYLKEVISDNPKMWIPESTATKNFFNNLLKFSFIGQSTDSIYITPEILDHVQIYWPYSENWDGVTMPLITWYGERVNSTTNFAYTYYNGQLRRLRVDDAYAEQYPVWIINSARFPHSCFPTLVIEDDETTGARDSGSDEDEEEEEEDNQKILKDFMIEVPNLIIQFQQGFEYGPDGLTPGGGIRNFITDEDQIDPMKSYKISVGSITVNKNYSFNFDDGDIHILFQIACYDSIRKVINYKHAPLTVNRKGIGTPKNIKFILINSWNFNAKHIALLGTSGETEYEEMEDSSFSGILKYEDGIILSQRFEIKYNSNDNLFLKKIYTWDEFFSNEVMQSKHENNNISWYYFIEEN